MKSWSSLLFENMKLNSCNETFVSSVEMATTEESWKKCGEDPRREQFRCNLLHFPLTNNSISHSRRELHFLTSSLTALSTTTYIVRYVVLMSSGIFPCGIESKVALFPACSSR